MAIVYEEHLSDISWYSNEMPNGSAKNNFDRILELRKTFCHPLTINKDGTLNKKYFAMTTHETAMNWNDIEILQLYEGIFKHGVASVESWIKIQSDFLPQRDFIEVRLKLSQLLGIQDLTQYKGRTFTTEKEFEQEHEQNKKRGMENGTWNHKCKVTMKQDVANLTKEQVKELQQKELGDWIKYIYNNPRYIYRTNAKTSKTKKGRASRSTSNNDKNKNKNKNKNKKSTKKTQKTQKNTIDKMLKTQSKKGTDLNAAKGKKDDEEMQGNKNEIKDKNKNKKQTVNEDEDSKMVDVEKQSRKTTKSAKNKKKVTKRKPGVPLLPEDSDDEDMLCVE